MRLPSTTTAVLRFVVAGLLAAAVVSAGAYWVVSRNAVAEAIRNAQEIAAIDGRAIVSPALTDAVIAGDAAAMQAFDRTVQDRVLSSRVVRIKIWTTQGRILYSDVPALVGRAYPLGSAEREAIRQGSVVAEVSDLSKPENQYERGYHRLLEVYLPIHSATGQVLLFETYQVYSSIEADQQRIWSSFFPVLAGGILLLFVVQVPLAWRLARDLRSSLADREALLNRAIDASAAERRRIARDLHDGVVQTLAGVAFGLGAAAAKPDPGGDTKLNETLRQSAMAIRQSVRDLRSLIVEIAPPDLDGSRLESAIADLLAPLEGESITTSLEATGLAGLDREQAALLHRAAQEAIRNAVAHAGATRVDVVVRAAGGSAVLDVTDNGRGFTADEVLQRQREGHVGLAMLKSLVEDGGGQIALQSRPGEGTRVEVRLGAA